jgi:hypothetical protein
MIIIIVRIEKSIPAHINTSFNVLSGSKILFIGSFSLAAFGIDEIVVITEKNAPQDNEAKNTNKSLSKLLDFIEFKLSLVTR